MARRPSGTPATLALDRAGIDYTQHTYRHEPTAASYGLEAAAQLGLDPTAVFKTLLAEVDGAMVVAVVPVSGHLDLKALASAVGGKRSSMTDALDAERATGYVVGGISPIGQRRRLRTVVDESALTLSTMYVSGGRRGLDLGVTPGDLVDVLEATLAPIGRTRMG